MFTIHNIEVLQKKLVKEGITDWDYLEHLWATVQRAWNPDRDYLAILKDMHHRHLQEGVTFPFEDVIQAN